MKNSEQPAFAVSKEMAECSEITEYPYGLTKREYFEAKAMQGLLSNPEWMKEYQGEKYLMQSDIIAGVSLQIADSVLERLSNDNQAQS